MSELEEENSCLRQALNLPPSSRPPLGKGPTGKDKPKVYEGSSTQSLSFHSSRESSAADSPTSRESSVSPPGIASLSSRPMHVIESHSWDDSLLLDEQPHPSSDITGPSESSYSMAPMSAPLPLKPVQYSSYASSIASSSRNSLSSNNVYMGNASHYAHNADRPLSTSYGGHSFPMRTDLREEAPRAQYSYAETSFQSHDPNLHSPNMHSQSPSPNFHSHSQHNSQRDSPMPYPHKRSLTDPHGFSIGQGFPHLPSPVQLQVNPRPPDFTRQADMGHSVSRSPAYGPDGRLNSIA